MKDLYNIFDMIPSLILPPPNLYPLGEQKSQILPTYVYIFLIVFIYLLPL